MAAHPEGCPDALIAQALAISVEEVEQNYQKIVRKLRTTIRA